MRENANNRFEQSDSEDHEVNELHYRSHVQEQSRDTRHKQHATTHSAQKAGRSDVP
jgi:hypothetical protein